MGTCKRCGCTDNNCSQCIEKTSEPCYWVDNNQDLCSACEPEELLEKLETFGKVEKVSSENNEYEFLITDGFQGKATITFECLDLCQKIAHGYPYIKKFETDVNKFHLVLTNKKK